MRVKFMILDAVVVTAVECSLGQPWYVVACQCPEIQKKNMKKCVTPVLENLKHGKRRGDFQPKDLEHLWKRSFSAKKSE